MVSVAGHGLPLVAASGGETLLRCSGFSWFLLLPSTGSGTRGLSG